MRPSKHFSMPANFCQAARSDGQLVRALALRLLAALATDLVSHLVAGLVAFLSARKI